MSFIAFDAEGTLFFDREAGLARADGNGIAVVALPREAEGFLEQIS